MKWQWEEEGGDGLTKLGGWNEMNIPAVLPPRNLDGLKNENLKEKKTFLW